MITSNIKYKTSNHKNQQKLNKHFFTEDVDRHCKFCGKGVVEGEFCDDVCYSNYKESEI